MTHHLHDHSLFTNRSALNLHFTLLLWKKNKQHNNNLKKKKRKEKKGPSSLSIVLTDTSSGPMLRPDQTSCL